MSSLPQSSISRLVVLSMPFLPELEVGDGEMREAHNP